MIVSLSHRTDAACLFRLDGHEALGGGEVAVEHSDRCGGDGQVRDVAHTQATNGLPPTAAAEMRARAHRLLSSTSLSFAVFCGSCLRACRRMTSGMSSLPIPRPSKSRAIVTWECLP